MESAVRTPRSRTWKQGVKVNILGNAFSESVKHHAHKMYKKFVCFFQSRYMYFLALLWHRLITFNYFQTLQNSLLLLFKQLYGGGGCKLNKSEIEDHSKLCIEGKIAFNDARTT